MFIITRFGILYYPWCPKWLYFGNLGKKHLKLVSWRPIGDPSETDMSDQRLRCLIGYWHVWSKTHISDRRQTCLIGDQHVWSEKNMLYWRLTMPDWRPTWLIRYNWHAWSDTHRRPTCLIMHVRWGLSVSDEACRSGSQMKQVSLRSNMLVSNESPIVIIFWWTPKFRLTRPLSGMFSLYFNHLFYFLFYFKNYYFDFVQIELITSIAPT